MFVVEVGAVLTLMPTISPTIFGGAAATSGYNLVVTIILILTVWFANYAEAVAEGRGRAQAATLRRTKKETPARPPTRIGCSTSSTGWRRALVGLASGCRSRVGSWKPTAETSGRRTSGGAASPSFSHCRLRHPGGT